MRRGRGPGKNPYRLALRAGGGWRVRLPRSCCCLGVTQRKSTDEESHTMAVKKAAKKTAKKAAKKTGKKAAKKPGKKTVKRARKAAPAAPAAPAPMM